MSGEAWAEAQDVGDQVVGKFIAVLFGELGEVGCRGFEIGAGGAVSLGIESMAGGAVLLEHGFAGGDEIRGIGVLSGGGGFCVRRGLGGARGCGGVGGCDEADGCGENQNCERKPNVAHGVPPGTTGASLG